jgi:hypothetical protein
MFQLDADGSRLTASLCAHSAPTLVADLLFRYPLQQEEEP